MLFVSADVTPVECVADVQKGGYELVARVLNSMTMEEQVFYHLEHKVAK